ncbi:hypothetical protein DRP04_11210 [Archaeoglobales archaeon]|nr:MAG: hypothetical protein DRP04_11210 [Archaeoglobales archaeon]
MVQKTIVLDSESVRVYANADEKQLEIIAKTKDVKSVKLNSDGGNIEILINGVSVGLTIINQNLLKRIQFLSISEEKKKSLINFLKEIPQKIKENKYEILEIAKIATDWVKIIIGFIKS